MDKKKVPTPRADPRYTGAEGETRRANANFGSNGYQEYQGSLSNPKEHPAYNKPDATEHYQGEQAFKDVMDTYGSSQRSALETQGMLKANNISEDLKKRFDD